MTMPSIHAIRRCILAGSIAAGVAILTVPAIAQDEPEIADFIAEQAPPSFDQAADAAKALEEALAADDIAAVAALLGLDADRLKGNAEAVESHQQIRQRAAERVTVRNLGDSQIVEVGTHLWPLPFPIAKAEDGKWAFDTEAGLDEIVARRVGENELTAIATAYAYIDAQREYASVDRDSDGVQEYAQKLRSSPGLTDGLYWPAGQGDGESPVGEFIDQDELAGAKAGDGYFGYRYRILKGQGDNIAGGGYDYVINDNMIAGFALIAWPVRYGQSGVQTFVVSHHGIVYERDLGEATEDIVPFIDSFNPDESWEIIGPSG